MNTVIAILVAVVVVGLGVCLFIVACMVRMLDEMIDEVCRCRNGLAKSMEAAIGLCRVMEDMVDRMGIHVVEPDDGEALLDFPNDEKDGE